MGGCPSGTQQEGAPPVSTGQGRLVRVVVGAIQLYRHMISPLRPATCRFMPTCSQYAADALGEYGLIRGGWLAVVRLAKCGPWHAGGWDPIPERPDVDTGVHTKLRSVDV